MLAVRTPGASQTARVVAACDSAFPFERQGRLLRSRSISGLFSRSLHSGLQPPCLRSAAAVPGRHARLGSRLLARLCRGRHRRRQTSTRLQGATRTDPYEPNSGIRLLPRVSDGKALLRPRKKDFRLRKPVISDLLDPLPRDHTVLTASRQRAAPEVNHVMAECSDRCRVGRHGVICEIASDNLPQPAPLLGDRPGQPVSHPPPRSLYATPPAVPPGFPLEREPALTGTSAD